MGDPSRLELMSSLVAYLSLSTAILTPLYAIALGYVIGEDPKSGLKNGKEGVGLAWKVMNTPISELYQKLRE